MSIWQTVEQLQQIAQALAAGRHIQALAVTCEALHEATQQLEEHEAHTERLQEEETFATHMKWQALRVQ